HRVTQLPAENLWHRERSSVGLLLFLVERAAIPEFQEIQLANDLVEVGPNATPFGASLLEERMECEDFIGIHRVVVRGQTHPMLSSNMPYAEGFATVAKKDTAKGAANNAETVVGEVVACNPPQGSALGRPFGNPPPGKPRRRGLALQLAEQTAVALQ